MTEAYAVYREDVDWIPLSSISADPDVAQAWVYKTYASASSRERCRVVKIRIKIYMELS